MISDLPDRSHVLAADRRIAGQVARTPLRAISTDRGDFWVKCECLQTGGAFKLRGATNRLLKLDPAQRRAGVVAFSSGNHAQGVAIAARRLGIPALIVMPSDAPRLKVDGTRAQGADVHFYDRRTESREAIASRLADERGAVLVPSFDDSDIVAGQGTTGLEIASQLAEMDGRDVGTIVVPTGGGGLASGIALACPSARIVCVEPEGWDDMRRSLEAGHIIPVGSDAPETLCDALQTPRVSPITFAILRAREAQAVAVSEAAVRDAIVFAWSRLGLVVEGGGAVALAAILTGSVPIDRDGATVAILSGGNIDPMAHAGIVGDAR